MNTSKLSQFLGTQELEAKYGSEFTIAKLLYTTLAADDTIPASQLASEVARTLPALAKIGSEIINEWAQKYGWNQKV
ncbi:hypothetical protein C6497_07200 [Candidatus Poribacteria bacterium]|nr:MAG: hypothetical protein C6497_07200 [Candidatus Poribacteria bacterium]